MLNEQSVQTKLLFAIYSKSGCDVFKILCAPFKAVLRTYIMSKLMKATEDVDLGSQINVMYLETDQCLNKIKRCPGGFSKDLVLALTFHQRCQLSYQEIVNVLDSRMAVNEMMSINSKYV